MNRILPFCINDIWYGMPIEYVLSVDNIGIVTPVPKATKPIIGAMHHKGIIFPVWNIGNHPNINQRIFYIHIKFNDRDIAIPADKVDTVIDVQNPWVSYEEYGLKLFRSLNNNLNKDQSENVVEVKHEVSDPLQKDTLKSFYKIEDINTPPQ